ncbi:MAG: hypothetical protein RI949_907 [Pseudomonadota bacterium]
MSTTPPPSAPQVHQAPQAPQAPKARLALARSLWRTVLVALVGPPLVAGLAAWSVLHTESGTRGLLPLLPLIPGVQITVEHPRGALLGEQFGARKLRVAWHAGQAYVEVLDFEWRGAHWRWWTGPGLWATARADTLVAREVVVQTGPSSGRNVPPLSTMRLPLEIEVQQVQAGEVRVDQLTPFLSAQGRVHLGRDLGARHEVTALTFDWGRARAEGEARLEGDRPFNVQASVKASQKEGLPFVAQAQAQGTFADFTVKARWQGEHSESTASASKGVPMPQLDATVQVMPFQAWPLGTLQLSTRAWDLNTLGWGLPHTRISGQAWIGRHDASSPLEARADLRNDTPGRWDQQALPIGRLRLEAKAPSLALSSLDIKTFDVTLASGRWSGRGQWSGQDLHLDTRLQDLRPQALDRRAPAMRLSGPLSLQWRGAGASSSGSASALTWKGELEGRLDETPQVVTLNTQGEASAQGLEIQRLHAVSGQASADVKLRVRREKGNRWHAQSEGALSGFDPAAWYPGPEGTAWRKGPNRVHARWQLDLTAPLATAPRALPQWLQSLQGEGRLDIQPSQLAGVALEGSMRMEREASSARSRVRGELRAGRNRVEFEGSGDPLGPGDADQLRLQIQGQALADLAPLASIHADVAQWMPRQGSAEGQLKIEGRWPQLKTSGAGRTKGLQAGPLSVSEGSARWQVATGRDQPWDVQLEVLDAAWGAQRAKVLRANVQGTSQSHRIQLEAAAPLQPPPSLERAFGLRPGEGTQALVVGTGSWETLSSGGGSWRGQFDRLSAGVWDGSLKSAFRPEGSWFDAQGLRADIRLDSQGRLTAVRASAGQAQLAGGVPLRWDEFVYQSVNNRHDLILQAEVPATPVAPFLQRASQGGWSGDLKVGARVSLRATDSFHADLVLRREGGDLLFTDNGSQQAMGLTAAELTMSAHDGVWKVAPRLAGKTLGQLSGAFTLRTSPALRWPDTQADLEGSLDLSVSNLGIWSAWVPPGWRIAGALNTTARLGGRFGAPQFTGELLAQGVDVRNLLQGIAFSQGELKVALNGETARVERLRLRAGDGELQAEGQATLGLAPTAQLKVQARQFRVLGRVDRQLVLSGQGDLALQTDKLQALGQLKVDSGLFDLSSRDAPTLDDDVKVLREGTQRTSSAEAPGPSRWARGHQVAVSIDLGEHLRVKGRGLDTTLKGQVQLSTPGGHLSLQGSLDAAGGTYAAYGQKMEIERGVVAFSGALESARLDILALRPNIDYRVGVSITGGALNPRVRLYSEPAMGESDKLSWLVLGRGSEGLGRADTAVLQRAAVALMAGEGEGPNDSLIRAFGLDNVSLRQGDTDVRETVISLGKQLSQRWYVGYERGVNATSGTWQLIYRIAQRFTLRAQSGLENSLDLIWTWRFDKP